MLDPTRDEMLAFLETIPFAEEFGEFDREEAVYWFANDYHGGQSSNLYSALSTSPFNPGPLASKPSDDGASVLYDELEYQYGVK